jgi:hypothetical protein
MMVAWLRRVLGLCEHKWKLHKEIDLVERQGALPHAKRFILQCTRCGNVKAKEL